MKALVVYESMFGNTEQVARDVAGGLARRGVDVGVVVAGDAPTDLPPGLDLLVIGAPTHAFSLSRPATRADAVRQGAAPDRAGVGVREWLESLTAPPSPHPRVAAFDTRASSVRWLPRAAGPAIARLARRRGLRVADAPTGFLVTAVDGPLADGERTRARELGERLADLLTARPGPEGVPR